MRSPRVTPTRRIPQVALSDESENHDLASAFDVLFAMPHQPNESPDPPKPNQESPSRRQRKRPTVYNEAAVPSSSRRTSLQDELRFQPDRLATAGSQELDIEENANKSLFQVSTVTILNTNGA